MDLVDTLQKKIGTLDEGEHMPGLKAVLSHIETAFRHLSRGQASDDDTAFTDAIYRTNQAFEGSVKEAYRVLAGQDPAKKRPFDIENYLEQNNIFRSRVLSQLTTYRTEWRNPSTHDYKLDFDESEAFLAIVSVSAFACLLLDQMAERLAFNKSQAEAEAQKAAGVGNHLQTTNQDFLTSVAQLVRQFCALPLHSSSSANRQTEVQFIGALHGFLASTAPELTVDTEVGRGPANRLQGDLVVTRGENEKLMIEVKRRFSRQSYSSALAQMAVYFAHGSINDGILLFIPEHPSPVNSTLLHVGPAKRKLIVIAPASARLYTDAD
jgi:hypothetical protein